MTTLYLIDMTGDGTSRATAFRANVPADVWWRPLMQHEAKMRALIVADDGIVTGNARPLVQATTVAGLRTKAKNNNPTAAQRTTIATWLAANGYQALPAGAVSWWDVVHFIARQVNPAANLDLTG